MPPKAKIQAPIDRPLSRAYLREFSGWSTAYPPGLSDPTSLRLMENVQINRDGSCRVRPGLRYLSYVGASAITVAGTPVVGSHEVFFLNSGQKAYLFAVRELDDSVGFRVAEYDPDLNPPFQVKSLTHPDIGFDVPQGEAVLNFSSDTTYVKYVQIDNKIIAMSNAGEAIRVFYVGADKVARKILSISQPDWNVADKLIVVHPDQTQFPTPSSPVTAETATANTLVSSVATDNDFNFGYFYTFTNEIGESAASQITVIRTQRRWSVWKWETPNGAGEPSGVATADPDVVADQLVAYMPESVFDTAVAEGATAWNLYMLTWSDQDSVPPEAVLLATRDLTTGPTWETHGWIRHTPQNGDYNYNAPLPNITNRYNYSDPSKAAQGLVAADRLILVNDPTASAVIRWSSNQQGSYTDFTAAKGGGYKTLTSGNLFIPACVKLWQNPQSADTLTILCSGVDGHSTGYYMAPAQVTSQSESTAIMGFEETTATPGTTSPYGCEVMNNALYHPIDTELMKSTASNYNINHKSQSEMIANRWIDLENKHRIVSSQHDSRIYLIVHNPYGEELEPGCMGNEVWVFDGGTDAGSWSRWLVQAESLRKIEVLGQIYMSVVRPDGIYYFDPYYYQDDFVPEGTADVEQRNIPWKLETNTQGANRAHDAWANLQQVNIVVGSFLGSMRYGVRGWDLNGKAVERSKIVRDLNDPDLEELMPFDLEDQLLVARVMKEWMFFAESVVDDEGDVQGSAGQISLVQYRYTPSSVNTGYEHGSVETFEYGRATANWAERTTDAGVPTPTNDVRRP